MLFLLVLLTGLGGLQAGLDSHKTFLHTTVPEKISSSATESDPENNVAYMITINKKPYFAHLKKQFILSPVSVVYTYNENNTQEANSLLDQMNCSYNGYIAGIPVSLVSLHICSGLRGTLQLQTVSYGIEPVDTVSEFMHLIYEDKDDNINIPLLSDNDSYIYNKSEYKSGQKSERVEFFKLFPQYLEIYIVVDKNLFDYMGSDAKAVTQKVIQIIGLVNTMLTQLKLTVVISAIEIWSNKNRIHTFGNPNHTLLRFLEWKSHHVTRFHHFAYLFSFKKKLSFKGAIYPGRICDEEYAGGVAMYPEGSSLESYTVSIVQLLGLTMGLSFDNIDSCYCSGDVCTMSPEAEHSRGVKYFSTCSLDELKYLASHSGLTCLHNNLPAMPVYKQEKKVCGNGKLEKGEQCDCGTLRTCTHRDCCDATSCRLKPKKACGSGECCTKDCKLKPHGTLCRKSMDKECDFNEYCNGLDPHCVPNTYMRNGQSCNSGEAYCYSGKCRLFDQQCRNLIGGATRGAPFACFEEINSLSDRYGNCGRQYCPFPDLMCGKLVCTWPHKTLVSRTNLSVIYTHIRDETCVSTYQNSDRTGSFGVEDRDATFVEDGSTCGPEMMCVGFKCLLVRYLINLNSCNSAKHCSSRGVCNNFQHCHCNKGFAPPNCTEVKGQFGSVDDGHKIDISRSLLDQKSIASTKHRFQLIFYISLPVLIIIAAVLIKQDKIKELCYKGETESERSVSEDSSNNINLSPSESNSF